MKLWALQRFFYFHLVPKWWERLCVRYARRRTDSKVVMDTKPLPRRLFLDLSVISRSDAGTGIQRVVRGIARQLLQEPPAGWRVIPLGASAQKSYHPIAWDRYEIIEEDCFEARAGDVFFALDYALDTICLYESQLAAFRKAGGRFWVLMHDLLPFRQHEWFSDGTVVRYRKWLSTLARQADGFFCVSPSTENDLHDVLSHFYALKKSYLSCVLPLGWNIAEAKHSEGTSDTLTAMTERMRSRPTALMIGTLEPRKAHIDIVNAFDLLWLSGTDYCLVIVGRPGWKTEALQQRLRIHPQLGQRLFWLNNISDEELEILYHHCDGVIAASYAEGFGLPVIEALGHKKPVLARDIAVFHTINTSGISYFPAESDTATLADHITTWLQKTHDQPVSLNLPSWSDTARVIIQTLDEGSI